MSTDQARCFLKVPKVSKNLNAWPLQTNLGELNSFCPSSRLVILAQVEKYASTNNTDNMYVLDIGDSDFRSQANFGRGHDHKVLATGCPTLFEIFLSRLGNSAMKVTCTVLYSLVQYLIFIRNTITGMI